MSEEECDNASANEKERMMTKYEKLMLMGMATLIRLLVVLVRHTGEINVRAYTDAATEIAKEAHGLGS